MNPSFRSHLATPEGAARRGPSPRAWLRVLAIALTVGTAVAAVMALGGRPSKAMIAMALGCAAVIALLGAVGLPPLMRRLDAQGGGQPWLVLPAAVVGLAAVGGLATGLAAVGLGLLPSGQLWRMTWPTVGIAVVTALGIGVGIALNEQIRTRRREVALIQQATELEAARAAQLASSAAQLAAKAQLASIEARLSPHFLYNTLNAVAAQLRSTPRAYQMICDLAALLRVTLRRGERATVPLADELNFATSYLDIQAARFPRLTYTVDVPAALLEHQVPPFALQVVVENSVTHVVDARPGPARMRIEARAEAGQLALGVWDDGPGFSLDAVPRGHALGDLRARLAALYGETAGLAVDRRDGGTLVTIRLPLGGETWA
jgi:signal transduction histidine kinase